MGDPRTEAGPGPDTTADIDGEALARALTGGTEALRRQVDAINAINVFPVPDGDTGTNMHLTMRAALDEAERAPARDAASLARTAAHGALMGAKGNSGVILSQILSGFAAGLAGPLDAASLAAGLRRGRDAAYRTVSAPKEGTILTAINDAALGASEAAERGAGAVDALAAATDACEAAVARTPELLPVLKEAGVVDSGAQGLFVLLEGMVRALRGEAIAGHHGGFGAIDPSWLAATRRLHGQGTVHSGFCTEFVISGQTLDPQPIRERLSALGDSLLVVGGGDLVHVHVHTARPDEALAYGRSLGNVLHEKVEDMEAQFRVLAASAGAAPAVTEGIAVVAVGAGAGIEELLRSMGASVVRGGQTMNPSAGEIRAAIERTGAADVIVLPNNKNIVMAARQAGEGIAQRVRVIETQSVPQGVAALVALNTELPAEDNAAAMREAAEALRHAEITHAARATNIHGLHIRAGQPIGIVDGDLTVAAETIAEAVHTAVRQMIDGRNAALVTLYAGEGEDDASAEAIASALRQEFGVEVDVVPGGQPHYPYLIGAE